MSWENRVDQLLKDGNSVYESGKVIHRECFPEEPEARIIERVRGYVRRRNERIGRTSTSDATDTVEHIVLNKNDDGSFLSERLIKIALADMKNPDSVMLAHGFDPSEWEMVSCRNNLWSMNSSEEDKVNCQSKITVKPKAKGLSLSEIDEHFSKMDREHVATQKHYKIVNDGSCMAVVHLADVHLGKLCWHGDTPQDYDQHIARETFMRLISEIATELEARNPEYITFVWSNDFFNSDTTTNTTTAGTPMDSTDMRFTKLFNVGCDLLVSAIEVLSTISPVKTFYISSNHSELTDYHALQYLKAWFRKDENVTVNIEAYPRKYVLYGNTLLGFTHGGKEKARNLALLMPIEARDLWSQSKYAELHCAHLHSEQMIVEGNGVIIRRIASPTPSDNWHTDNGYIGNVRKAQTFVYDKDKGLILTINTPV